MLGGALPKLDGAVKELLDAPAAVLETPVSVEAPLPITGTLLATVGTE